MQPSNGDANIVGGDMANQDNPVALITWIVCVPDPNNPRRTIPFLHLNRGTVWFSEPQYIDRFIREQTSLPPGACSRAVVGVKRLITFARELLVARVSVVYFDLEVGKPAPGVRLGSAIARLEEQLSRTSSSGQRRGQIRRLP